MLFKNKIQAQKADKGGASWITRVYVTVTLKDGRTFVRTYDFNSMTDKCKRCRKATRKQSKSRPRIASTGHVCECCGNPYAGFVRLSVRKENQQYNQIPHCWGSSGLLH